MNKEPHSPVLTENSETNTKYYNTNLINEPIKYHPATECVFMESHIRDPYHSSSAPVYITATFKQQSASSMGEFDYSRSGNPTRTHLESHLAKLMCASRAFALSSGMTALDIITRLVSGKDEIIAGNDLYGGTNRLLNFLKSQHNIVVHHVDTTRVDSVRDVLNENTKLVLLESPTNPLIKIADIPKITEWTRRVSPNALVVVDNTMVYEWIYKVIYIMNLDESIFDESFNVRSRYCLSFWNKIPFWTS